MGYRTYSIILKIDTDTDKNKIEDYLTDQFRFFNIREFHSPFEGIICQGDDRFTNYPYDKFPDNYFKNQEEVEEYFTYGVEEKLIKVSEIFKEKEIVYIDVDCHGGRCLSEGYVIKNGKKLFEQDIHDSGHSILLKKIYANYNNWFFYPFTRTFFKDVGGLNGDIINFSFAAIWMALDQEFSNNSNYTFQATGNEMLLECHKEFSIYFMKINDDWIKVMGSLYKNDESIFEKVKTVLEELLLGIEYNIQIDNFENGTSISISVIDENKNKEIKAISYRATSFNSQTFDLSKPETDSKDEKKNNTKKKGFFGRIFGK